MRAKKPISASSLSEMATISMATGSSNVFLGA
jgi:hypothetical protein